MFLEIIIAIIIGVFTGVITGFDVTVFPLNSSFYVCVTQVFDTTNKRPHLYDVW